MSPYKSLIMVLMIAPIQIGAAIADTTKTTNKQATIKTALIAKMYQQDMDEQGMSQPPILQQYANDDLLHIMQLEQVYFEKHQASCNLDYDVLWNSQDPDYTQDKKFSMTDKGLVQVSLAQGSNIYYDLTCNDKDCQIADVSLNEDGGTLSKHLLETCR